MAVRQRAMATLPKLIRSMRKQVPKQHNITLPSLRRAFSLYDQINLIDSVTEDQLRFQEFDETSFTVNGVKYEGSLLCVGNLLMSWSPRNFSEITTDSLSIFQTVRPIPVRHQWIFTAFFWGAFATLSRALDCRVWKILPPTESSSSSVRKVTWQKCCINLQHSE